MANITPSLLNEVRFGMNEIPNYQQVGVLAADGVRLLGVQGIPEVLYPPGRTGYPSAGITGLFAPSQYSDAFTNTRMWNIYANLSYIRGRHTVKTGVDLRLGEQINLVNRLTASAPGRTPSGSGP